MRVIIHLPDDITEEEQDLLMIYASKALLYWQKYNRENETPACSGAIARYEFQNYSIFTSVDKNKTGYTIRTWFEKDESKEMD